MAAATESANSGIFWMSSEVGGKRKTRPPFDCGSDSTSTSTSSNRGTKMPTRRGSNWKNDPKLKTGSKKQSLSPSNRSVVFPVDEVSACHRPAEPAEQFLFPAPDTIYPPTQRISETSGVKSLVCLKDLCPEDKRRIANLIEELARVSEEKEESVQRLKDEQENFERKIQQLEQQNVLIAHERESMQQQYKECQELLGLYQQYLSQQQAQLNQSIAQLSQDAALSKVLTCDEASSRTSTSRSNVSLLDGSYLNLAASQSQQPQAHRKCGGGRPPVPASGDPTPICCVTGSSAAGGPSRSRTRECREPHSQSERGCWHCRCHFRDSRRQQCLRCNDSHLECSHAVASSQHDCERLHAGNAPGSEVKEALKTPVLGHEDWEEKRHRLLLQKMQLEAEREKLQARLAEQEERLDRQNQLLNQSRLRSSSSTDYISGHRQHGGPSDQQLPTSVSEDAEGQSLREKHSQTVAAPRCNDSEALKPPRKDVATSPAKSPTSLTKPTPVSETPEARLDFSMVDLLDILSPVSAPKQSKPSARRPETSQHRSALKTPGPVSRTVLTPARSYLHHTLEDPEESQILEDIFFIC